MQRFYGLRDIAYQSLIGLSTEDGINASSKNEVFGCIFGRDSAITCLKIIRVIENTSNNAFVDPQKLKGIVRNSLLKLVNLQGKEINNESGEEPGKFIHEYRKDKFERLVNRPNPWFVYPDGILRNYDSIDSTPLALIALYRYWEVTKDNRFLLKVLPAVELGLNWIKDFADLDRDNLVEYEFSASRKHGGLKVQSWTDSFQSLAQKDGSMPLYPIAPVEVQGYAWLSLKLWGEFFKDFYQESNKEKAYSKDLLYLARLMKKRFNKSFIFRDNGLFFPAQALDGRKNQIKTVTGNPLLLLWATYTNGTKRESILDDEYIPDLISRSFQPDLFDEDAGIRTMSAKALTFNPNIDSYHNGSFWPKLNGMIHEGLEKWNYFENADKLKEASLKPIAYFQTPVELYIRKEENYFLYRSPSGQESCRNQAWSAAAILDLLKTQ